MRIRLTAQKQALIGELALRHFLTVRGIHLEHQK